MAILYFRQDEIGKAIKILSKFHGFREKRECKSTPSSNACYKTIQKQNDHQLDGGFF